MRRKNVEPYRPKIYKISLKGGVMPLFFVFFTDAFLCDAICRSHYVFLVNKNFTKINGFSQK